jgi:iron complex outermembrane receptor protein/outer membrane receptor for ferrienterochelin and colicins
VNYKKEFGKEAVLFINQAFYLTQIDHPIVFNTLGSKVFIMNEDKPVVTRGWDTYLKFNFRKWELYGGYTYTDAQRTYLKTAAFVPLTPRNRLAFVVVKEWGEDWRLGLECSFIGKQYRYDGTGTTAYSLLALMVQRKLGQHFALVANCENLLNVKMSDYEPLFEGKVTNPAFKPLWAPIDGRVLNVSVRYKL